MADIEQLKAVEGQALEELTLAGESFIEHRAAGRQTAEVNQQFDTAMRDFRRAERKRRRAESKARKSVR